MNLAKIMTINKEINCFDLSFTDNVSFELNATVNNIVLTSH